jgi:hypothetical protein
MFRTTASVDDPSSRTILVHPPKGDRSRTETFQIQRRLWNVSEAVFWFESQRSSSRSEQGAHFGGPGRSKKDLHQGNIRSVGASAVERSILIATSVVEEGVDVQACSFVLVFDTLKEHKGIQMKGRARQKDAKFLSFKTATMFQEQYFFIDCTGNGEQSASIVF